MKIIYDINIIPQKFIIKNNIRKITKINNPLLLIDQLLLIVNDDLIIEKIYTLDKLHPNCDNRNHNLFCKPDNVILSLSDKQIKNNLKQLLETYNLNSCYFDPLSYLEWDILF